MLLQVVTSHTPIWDSLFWDTRFGSINNKNFRQDYRIDVISKKGPDPDPVYRESLP